MYNNQNPIGFPTNKYGPFGYNDNNLNRQHIPSNVYPPQKGLSGSGFGNYQPLTTNQMRYMNGNISHSDFNQAFQQPNPLIERMDYTNKNNLIHNNVGHKVLDEHIVEYRINIDSLDRDIRIYPNPFKFTVKFNPPAGGTVRHSNIKQGKHISRRERFTGPPQPHINKEFKNVKYIKLDNIILPQRAKIIKDNDKFILDPTSNLTNDRFVMLVIDEINPHTRTYCTYDGGERIDPITGKTFTPPCPFAHILTKNIIGENFFFGEPYYGSLIFINSQLGNINTLSIKLCDSNGILLDFENLFTFEDLEEAKNNGTPIPITDIRHPLNPKLQNHISFIIGVVEAQQNTDTKFGQR